VNIRTRFASGVLATVMALTAIGIVGAGVSANSGHGGPLAAIADIEDAQASYAARKYLQANREAVVALRSLRHLRAEHPTIPFLTSIGCGDEYREWNEKAITKMAALRLAAFGQGTKWAWAANPRLERVLALAAYRRANARYHTAEDAFIDCVLAVVEDAIPPDFILELAF
jgi:hypothetical protein